MKFLIFILAISISAAFADDGKYHFNNAWRPCVPGCYACSSTGPMTTVAECTKPWYGKWIDGDTIKDCAPNCEKCTSADKLGCYKPADGWFIDGDEFGECVPNCPTCTGPLFTDCPAGYSNTFKDETDPNAPVYTTCQNNCLKCTKSDDCKAVGDGYYIKDNVPKPCGITGCRKCSLDSDGTTVKCDTIYGNYFKDSTNSDAITMCITGCSVCDAATAEGCKTITPGYYLLVDRPGNCPIGCICSNTGACQTAANGYYLSGGNAVACKTGFKCTASGDTCTDVIVSGGDYTCYSDKGTLRPCVKYCTTCTGATVALCSAWKAGYGVHGATTASTEGVPCKLGAATCGSTECDTKQTLVGKWCNSNVVDSCQAGCKDCTDGTVAKCEKVGGGTLINVFSGYVSKSDGTDLQPCKTGVSVCTFDTGAGATEGSGCTTPKTGYVCDGANGAQACHPNCDTCTKGANAGETISVANCLNPKTGYYTVKDSSNVITDVKACDSAKGVATCGLAGGNPAHTYCGSANSGYSCKGDKSDIWKCSAEGCTACTTDANICSAVASGYRLNAGAVEKCLEGCATCTGADWPGCLTPASGFYKPDTDAKALKPCANHCIDCTYHLAKDCKKTEPNWFIDKTVTPVEIKQCVEGCDVCTAATKAKCIKQSMGWYIGEDDKGNAEVAKCAPKCIECMGGNRVYQCTKWQNGWFKKDTFAIKKCANNCKHCEIDDTVGNCKKPKERMWIDSADIKPCIADCEKCSGAGIDGCDRCADGFWKDTAACSPGPKNCADAKDGTICNKCKAGYWLNDLKTICAECDPACATCSAGTSADCEVCKMGTWLDSSATPKACKACRADCQACSSDTKCGMCLEGKYLDNDNVCQGLFENCGRGTGNTFADCKSCKTGYWKDTPNSKCVQCDASCRACNELGADKCTDCRYEFFLNANPGSCAACGSGCKECTSNSACTECLVGFLKNANNGCDACPTGCGVCSDANTCTKCKSGFFESQESGQPIACSGCSDGCAVCTDNTDATCSSCLPGYHQASANTKCSQCDPNCAECASADTCKVCKQDYKVDAGKCTSSITCPAGQYYNNGCAACEATCATCNGGLATNCLTCKDTAITVSNGACSFGSKIVIFSMTIIMFIGLLLITIFE